MDEKTNYRYYVYQIMNVLKYQLLDFFINHCDHLFYRYLRRAKSKIPTPKSSMRKLTVDITYASTTNHKCIGASSVNFLINVNTYFTLTLVEELNPSDIYKIPLKLHSFNKLTIYLQKSCLGADNTYLTWRRKQ